MSEVRNLHDDTSQAATPGAARSAAAMPSGAAATTYWRRRALLLVVPSLVIAASLYLYLHAGRYVETDNAYIKSDKAMISAEVAGIVARVGVQDNQQVAAGDSLFTLEHAGYQSEVNRAEAALAQVVLDIAADQLAYEEANAEVALLQSNVAYAATRFQRQRELRRTNLGTAEDLDDTRHALETARQEEQLASRKAARLLGALGGRIDIAADQHPRYQTALAELQAARLDLSRTVIHAPFAGVVANVPKLGSYVQPGRPVMAVLANHHMWVEANFKETQLTYIRPGQSVTVSIDTYPGEQWHGRVESIALATGAEFAVLPPQNATGNWVKIVQRIPLKIVLEPNPSAPELRMGMSATVSVDTGHIRHWRDLLPG